MKYFNCFNIVKLVTDEASNQLSPLFSENSLKLSRLKSQCDYINKIANQYNGISCEIEIDSITMEIRIMLTLADKHLALSSINCPQPVKSEIYLNEDNLICLDFLVPGIWSKSQPRKELPRCLN